MVNTQIASVDRAWAAGFYDGEGSTSLHATFDRKRSGEKPRGINPRMSISQVIDGERILTRFRDAVGGLGKLSLVARSTRTKAYPDGSPRQDIWTWRVNGFEEVQTVSGVLWPYLSQPKKDQIKVVLAKAIAGYDARSERGKKTSQSLILTGAAKRAHAA